jgi:hypothetical protein
VCTSVGPKKKNGSYGAEYIAASAQLVVNGYVLEMSRQKQWLQENGLFELPYVDTKIYRTYGVIRMVNNSKPKEPMFYATDEYGNPVLNSKGQEVHKYRYKERLTHTNSKQLKYHIPNLRRLRRRRRLRCHSVICNSNVVL